MGKKLPKLIGQSNIRVQEHRTCREFKTEGGLTITIDSDTEYTTFTTGILGTTPAKLTRKDARNLRFLLKDAEQDMKARQKKRKEQAAQ